MLDRAAVVARPRGHRTSSSLRARPGHDRGHRRDRRRQDAGGRGHRAARRRPGRPGDGAPGRRRGGGRGPLRRRRRRGRSLRRVVPREGRSRAYVDGRLATRRPSWPSRAPPSSTCTASTPTSRCCSPAVQRAALDRFGGDRPRAAADARARSWPRSTSALAALGGDERARAREIDLLRFQVDELDAAAIDRPRRGRAPRRRGGRCWPTPPAHREAGARRVDGAHRPTAAPSTPWPRRVAALDGRAPVRRRRRAGCAASPPSWPTSPPSCGAVGEAHRGRPRAPGRGPRPAPAAARAAPQVRRHAGRRHRVPRPRPRDRLAELEDHDAAAAELDAERRGALADGRGGRGRGRRGPARRPRPGWPRPTEANLARAGHAQGPARGRRSAATPGDDVAFLLAANPGAPPLPLAKVASGGELARAMLALRLVLTEAPAHAGVRRGRRRHRRRPRPRPSGRSLGRARPATTRCWSSPTCPRWRPTPTPRSAVRKDERGRRTVDRGRRCSTATSGSSSWPGCCRAHPTARPPASTPPSCCADGAATR